MTYFTVAVLDFVGNLDALIVNYL